MRDGYSIFDAHGHIGEALHNGRVHRADMMLARMDRHGIDRALAIPFPMVRSFREAHDEIGAAVRAHGDRIVWNANGLQGELCNRGDAEMENDYPFHVNPEEFKNKRVLVT